jgi:hypothetical protein
MNNLTAIAKLSKLSMISLGTAFVAWETLSPAARAADIMGFTGPYAPANWTLENFNADGSVDTTGTPNSIALTGGNNGSDDFGQTIYTITAAETGTVMFDWNYETFDSFLDPSADFFGYILNGNFFQLSDDFGAIAQNGTIMFPVMAGDVFGFEIDTADNLNGFAQVTIANFKAPVPIPEPLTILGSVTAVGFGVLFKKNVGRSPHLKIL